MALQRVSKAKAARRSKGEVKDRRAALAGVAKGMKGWAQATDVLTRVASVPTIFPYLDWATRVGGYPIERITLVHGESAHGKTELAHGVGVSFLELDHFYALMDAERTSPLPWLAKLMRGHEQHPGFIASHPDSYEDAVDQMRRFCYGIAEARDKAKLPKDTTGIAVLDSIGKLQPRGLMEKLLKDVGKEGIDGAGGRAGQIKAGLNKVWLDELVPMLHQTRTGMLIIAREGIEQDGRISRVKVGGGRHLQFESSLTLRVRREWIRQGEEIVGEARVVAVRKTKLGTKQDREDVAYFHTSNGKVSPVGFWRERDIYELGLKLGVITREGSNGPIEIAGVEVLSNTEAKAVAMIGEEGRAEMIEEECRKRFAVEGE